MSLEDTYAAAVALETRFRAQAGAASAAKSDASESVCVCVCVDDVLKAWQIVYGVAVTALKRADASPGSAQLARRAQMTALSRQAVLLEGKGLIRAAIRALEACIDISKSITRDETTMRGIAGILRKLATLHASVGSVDNARRYVTAAVQVERRLAGEAEVVSPTATAEASAPASPPVSAPVHPHAVPVPPTSAAHVPPVAASAPPAATAQSEAAPPATTAAPPQAVAPPTITSASAAREFLFPEYDAGDMSAQAVLSRVLRPAMFSANFDALVALLNKSLLGDAAATGALRQPLVPMNVTPLMVAASADRADVVRRVLALFPRATTREQITGVRDASGHTAVAHAVLRGAVRALDELLRALEQSGWKAAATGADLRGAFEDVGLWPQDVERAPRTLMDQLSQFLRDPSAYVRDFRPPIAPAASTPAPPSPAGWGPHPAAGLPPALALALSNAAWMQLLLLSGAAGMVPPMMAPGVAGRPSTAPALPQPSAPKPSAATAAPAAAAPPPRKGKRGGRGGAAAKPAARPPPSAAAPTAAAPATATPATSGRSRPPASGRELSKFQPDAVDSVTQSLLSATLDDAAAAAADGKRWDQFAANEKLFGVRASFPTELYTSALDVSKFSAEQIAAADAIAKQILQDDSKAGNVHVAEERHEGGEIARSTAAADDEELKYSAVARKGADGGAAAADTFTDSAIAAASSRGGKRGGRGGRGRGKPAP